jgi:hypothetical protein
VGRNLDWNRLNWGVEWERRDRKTIKRSIEWVGGNMARSNYSLSNSFLKLKYFRKKEHRNNVNTWLGQELWSALAIYF